MSQAALAQALGVSGAMVSRHKAMGMPVHSVAAAEVWRANNLDPFLLKAIRRPELCRATARPQRDRVDIANDLGLRAVDALTREAWGEFVKHVEALRAVLGNMTEGEEDAVLLSTQIWDALCGFPGPWLPHVRDEREK